MDGGLMRSRMIMMMVMVAVVVGLVVVVYMVRKVVCLHVPNDRLDVVAGEHARLAVAASFPPVGVGVVQDLDEVATSETQLSFLLRVKVKERLHICGMLWDLKKEKEVERQVSRGGI